MLSLAGMLLEAELPDNVRAGQELRLQVRELTPDKVVLAIQEEPQAATTAAGRAVAVPMPGGRIAAGGRT